MGGENRDNINLTELLLKISSDVSAIKTDMQNFKDSYKSEKENLLAKIEDVRHDCEKEMRLQEEELRTLKDAVTALKSEQDKRDAKKWRTVVAFILVGLGGMVLSLVPSFIIFVIKMKLGGK